MRHWLCFVMALVLVFPVEAQVPPPSTSPAPAIVLVHGRDQAIDQRTTVEAAWVNAVATALSGSSTSTNSSPDIRMFWYANALAGEDSCRYATGLRELAARAPGWSLWMEIRDRLVSAAGQLPSDVQRRLLEKRMQDVSEYLSNGGVACSVDNKFAETLQAAAADPTSPGRRRPLIVVAHSLGSMIVYKNLINRPPPDTLVYFLTIGSMLGDTGVQRTLLGSLADSPAPVPLPVRWWRNVINRGDFLAFRASTAFTSTDPSKRPVDDLVNLTGPDRHNAVEYLRGPLFARRLAEAVCLAKGGACKQ